MTSLRTHAVIKYYFHYVLEIGKVCASYIKQFSMVNILLPYYTVFLTSDACYWTILGIVSGLTIENLYLLA